MRKVKKPEDVKGASCHAYPLTPANLENALCKGVLEADNNMLPCEPVMIVVKVPPNKDSPLSSEIVLLDTPGLDSGLSNWTKESSERYSWIIENSDLLLFLQSSVAPLNRKRRSDPPRHPCKKSEHTRVARPKRDVRETVAPAGTDHGGKYKTADAGGEDVQ